MKTVHDNKEYYIHIAKRLSTALLLHPKKGGCVFNFEITTKKYIPVNYYLGLLLLTVIAPKKP